MSSIQVPIKPRPREKVMEIYVEGKYITGFRYLDKGDRVELRKSILMKLIHRTLLTAPGNYKIKIMDLEENTVKGGQ